MDGTDYRHARVSGAVDAGPAPADLVLVQRFDRSLFLANSLALQAAGIRAASPDPHGGEIVRDAKGEHAGWFPDQRLTIEEAIEAYTKGPAPASFEEDVKGTIVPGCVADLAVFDTDLVEAGRTALARLLQAKVLYTVAGGRVVYQR